jgi:hypothetical protein
VTSDQLEREFAVRGESRGGALILTPEAAIDLVRRARAERIPVLGLDAFRLSREATEPDYHHTLDFSGASCRTNAWAEAEAFLADRLGAGLHFEVVLGDRASEARSPAA